MSTHVISSIFSSLFHQKEEEKRQQKIEDWEGHLEGKGYRSKYKVVSCLFYP